MMVQLHPFPTLRHALTGSALGKTLHPTLIQEIAPLTIALMGIHMERATVPSSKTNSTPTLGPIPLRRII